MERRIYRKSFENRWEDGVFYGIIDSSGEIIVGTKDGVLKARSFRRKPESMRWDWEYFKEVKGTPWEPLPGRPGIEVKSSIFEGMGMKIRNRKEHKSKDKREQGCRIEKEDVRITDWREMMDKDQAKKKKDAEEVCRSICF